MLVGVNAYAKLQDLQFCTNDVWSLAAALEKARFLESNIFVLCDGMPDVKNLPTKDEEKKGQMSTPRFCSKVIMK